MKRRERRTPPLWALAQPDLPISNIPRDAILRQALIRLACSAEIYGPDGFGIDMTTPDGRQGWADVERAIRWIYEHAIDPIDDRGVQEQMRKVQAQLSDDELEAYAHHARAQSDEPLAALVDELQQRRKADAWRSWAIVILAASQARLLPALVTAHGGAPLLVIAPNGTRLPTLGDTPQAWTLETYDPSQPLELRDLFQMYGIGL